MHGLIWDDNESFWPIIERYRHNVDTTGNFSYYFKAGCRYVNAFGDPNGYYYEIPRPDGLPSNIFPLDRPIYTNGKKCFLVCAIIGEVNGWCIMDNELKEDSFIWAYKPMTTTQLVPLADYAYMMDPRDRGWYHEISYYEDKPEYYRY